MYKELEKEEGKRLEHIKTFASQTLKSNMGTLILEGPLSHESLQQYSLHPGLKAFRPAPQQYKALLNISQMPEGRIVVARLDDVIVGYVTILYPDPLERWSEADMDDLIELGAIEVISECRGAGVGKALVRLSMSDDALEDFIVITTEYYWHWDLKSTGLSVWDYRKMMEKMMNAGGLIEYTTDDPEITAHPANCLMARIGSRVPEKSIEAFDHIRFYNRYRTS